MNKKKLAIVLTHPIQYYAPLFRALSQSATIHPKVFYTWSQTAAGSQLDKGFGTEVAWDIPLLHGYEYEFVSNVAKRPGVENFQGIRNPGLRKALNTWGAEALLIYGWNQHSHLQLMRQMKGRLPIFFRGDSTLLDARPPLRRLVRKVALSWIYRHIDVAIAVGRNNADYFAWCGIPRHRIAFAPHSVDTQRFADAAQGFDDQAAEWRNKLGIGADDIAVIYAGKLIPKKDPELLIEAFLQLHTSAHLVLVGNGELEGSLKARSSGHANIHFLPFQNQSEMPAIYRVGDLFVLPSRGPGETWGLALNEAMACGRAVVAGSMAGGARDLIRQGINGWVFESGDVQGLVQILRAALDVGRITLQSMGREGQRLIGGWSTEAAATGIADVVSRHG